MNKFLGKKKNTRRGKFQSQRKMRFEIELKGSKRRNGMDLIKERPAMERDRRGTNEESF